jgi:dipeptidyl aminopeptidase/acylaminoacyl peptidase
MRQLAAPALIVAIAAALPRAQTPTPRAERPTAVAGLSSRDVLRLRAVGDVRFSPDGSRIAYTVTNNDGPGRPYSQLWIANVADGRSTRIGGADSRGAAPEWSRDGSWIAFHSRDGTRSGIFVVHPDGTGMRFVAETSGTNSPLPSTGNDLAWSPDGGRLAYVSSVPGPETADATGDPMVITRYLYRPDADEGMTRFNDNRRLHIFVADLAGGRTRQLTDGAHYEHSIDWAPNGDEILFVSNREPNEDQFFNYDILTVNASTGALRRLTATENAEYRPRWSPDGRTIAYQATRRGLTDLETTMEDTHVWTMNADGTNRVEAGVAVDNRQGPPLWAPDGAAIYFTVQERGMVRLYRLKTSGGAPERVVADRGTVGAFSVGRDGALAYAFASPVDQAELFLRQGTPAARRITSLNDEVLAGKTIAEVEPLTFVSNDNKLEIEAYLTRPLGMTATSTHPLIVVIHGGPHGQQGPAFNVRNQVYAARGWATLMVNYRGSTGYGQAFADAVFGDQNGNEGQDVLYGVGAAVRRNLWIDRDRIGVEGVSYGGQLSAWLVTQTSLFKAAIPTAAIINLVSYNYMTYYNQYEQMEFGILPHQGNLMDVLWERSALKHVAKVHTPVMLMHGENDNDVPIAEAEQFYIALKDVGVETVMVRYPREGHGLREPRHIVDSIDRSMAWYIAHFPPAPAGRLPSAGR